MTNHKEYLGKHVEFIRTLDEFEMEPGCRAIITSIVDEGDDGIKFEFDWSMYAEYNKAYYSLNWYDTNRKPTLRFHETKFYPNNHRDTYYFMKSDDLTQYFKIIEPDRNKAIEELSKCLDFARKNNLPLAEEEIRLQITRNS